MEKDAIKPNGTCSSFEHLASAASQALKCDSGHYYKDASAYRNAPNHEVFSSTHLTAPNLASLTPLASLTNGSLSSLANNYGQFTPPTPPNSESSESSLIHDASQNNFGDPNKSSHSAFGQALNGQQLIDPASHLNNLSQHSDSILSQLNSSIASRLNNLSSVATNQLINSGSTNSPANTKAPYTLSSSSLLVSTTTELAGLSRQPRPASSLIIKNEPKFNYFNSSLNKSTIYGYPTGDKLHPLANYGTFNGHLEAVKLGEPKTSQTELTKPANGRIVSKRRNNPELERRRIHKCLFNGCSKSYTKSSHLKVILRIFH